MVHLGGGVQSLKNNDLVLKFLNKLNIPVVTTGSYRYIIL